MDPAQFFGASRLVIVAGKGGVGKTTVSAAVASAAARTGLSVLLVELSVGTGLAALFGDEPIGYEPVALADGVVGRTITPDEALLEYLRDNGLARISKRLVSSGALEIVATAAPGIRDILVLGRVKALERDKVADLIVLDAPAAGHAITFLLSARGVLDAVRVGRIQAQARDVLELLTDAERCQVMLVTLPEETPVNELIDTAYHLEDRVGVSLGPVVINGVVPDRPVDGVDPVAAAEAAGASLRAGEAEALAAAARFRVERQALQAEQLDRLATSLPLPQLRLPYLFGGELAEEELSRLADELLTGVAAL